MSTTFATNDALTGRDVPERFDVTHLPHGIAELIGTTEKVDTGEAARRGGRPAGAPWRSGTTCSRARRAASRWRPGMVIALATGTTCLAVAMHVRDIEDVTVACYSLKIATASRGSGCGAIVPGGELTDERPLVKVTLVLRRRRRLPRPPRRGRRGEVRVVCDR